MRVEVRETCDPAVDVIAQNGPFWAAWGAFFGWSHTVKAVLIGDSHT